VNVEVNVKQRLGLLAILFILGSAYGQETTYQNSVYPFDFPDPFVLRVDSSYYAFATDVGDVHIPAIRSEDLATWRWSGDALPELPAWARQTSGLTWAPGVLKREDSFVLYYTTRDTASDRQCISRAVGDNPEGPYIDTSTEPFICQTDLGGSIDPYPFVDDGIPYLLWKNDGNCCDLPVGLWVQRLSEDGRSLEGERTELIRQDQLWERPLVENPAMWKRGGVYYLLYSANWWESAAYSLGYAVCETVTGPCVKPQEGPIFKAAGDVMGPGGEAFFTDTEGNLWLAYHAWTAPYVTYPRGARSFRIDRVRFEDGVPVIEGPTETPQPLGEAQ